MTVSQSFLPPLIYQHNLISITCLLKDNHDNGSLSSRLDNAGIIPELDLITFAEKDGIPRLHPGLDRGVGHGVLSARRFTHFEDYFKFCFSRRMDDCIRWKRLQLR